MAARRHTEEDFWAKVDRSGDCWAWLGSHTHDGYARYTTSTPPHVAHRAAWEFVNGPVPVGLQLDHLCHNRGCVNPDHLRLATVKQNAENRTTSASNTTGHRGVHFDQRRKMYRAMVGHLGRMIPVGHFASAEEAGAAAAAKREELFTPIPRPGESPGGAAN